MLGCGDIENTCSPEGPYQTKYQLTETQLRLPFSTARTFVMTVTLDFEKTLRFPLLTQGKTVPNIQTLMEK